MLFDQGQQAVFRNRVEVTFQVRIDHVNVTFLQFLFDDTQRIVSTSSVAEAEAPLVKLVIQNRFDHVHNRPLDDSVADRRRFPITRA